MARHGRAVFLDRDGVIVHEVDYLVETKQVRLIRGSAGAIERLRSAGFKVIVVSNQSAVARKMLSLKGLSAITRRLKSMLKAEGAQLDAVYYCPHHPDFGGPCACRKPGQALIRKAARRFKLDLKECFFVGDTSTDMMTAKKAGMTGFLVKTGYGGKDGSYKVKPNKVFKNLKSAVDWIL